MIQYRHTQIDRQIIFKENIPILVFFSRQAPNPIAKAAESSNQLSDSGVYKEGSSKIHMD